MHIEYLVKLRSICSVVYRLLRCPMTISCWDDSVVSALSSLSVMIG